MEIATVPAGWIRTTAVDVAAPERGAIVSGPFGSDIGKRFFAESGVPVIRGSNLTLGLRPFVEKGFVYVTAEKAHELRKCQALRGDIVFTAAGTLGQVGFIPPTSHFDRYIISNKQLRLRVNRERLDPLFAYFWFSQPAMRLHMQQSNRGSSVPLITLAVLRSLPVLLPPLATQRRIASILSAYDDLIANSERRIAILEDMARRIFREWFVDFRLPGHEAVPMVDTEGGRLPEGWDRVELKKVVNFRSGFAFKSETFSEHGKHRLITIKNVQDGAFDPETVSRIEFLPGNLPAHCILKDGDILLSLTGNVGRACLIYDGPFLLNQRVAKLEPVNDFDRTFTYCMFRDPSMRTKLEQISTGVAQQNLSPVLASQLTFACPPRLLRQRFAELAGPMTEAIVQLYSTSQRLRVSRDLLLPRLVSGELSVEAAEGVMEAAE